MRALILGYPLPNPAFDNYTFLNAPALFDYDAVVADPLSVSRVVEEVVGQVADHATYADQPIVNGPTSPVAVGLADQLLRRREETARLLGRGGLLVSFLRPNVVHAGVAGFAGCDRYCWLPAPSGLIYGSGQLMAGEGHAVVITDPAHPFARYIDEQRPFLRYHAYLADDRVPHFASFGRVFARSTGGAAVGVELAAGGGRVVFLPSPDGMPAGQNRGSIARTLLRCLEGYLGGLVTEAEPSWAEAEGLPGLEPLLAEEERLAERFGEAKAALTTARARREDLTKYRRLLWQEGKLGLEAVVRDALRLLGFWVTADLDEPAILTAEGETAFLEVEGSTEVVEMEPHYRLRWRREEELRRSGRILKGLVVVNGHRLLAPQDRPPQYIDALRIAGESMRYCLMTSHQLLALVREALAGADDEALRRIRTAILATEGELQHQKVAMAE
ncbi:MAG: hypothetical protein ACE5IZ_00135 [Dehalococcoidia bacterium]